MESDKLSIKPVFLKYRWPPKKNITNTTKNIPDSIPQRYKKEEIIINDIYQGLDNNQYDPSLTCCDSSSEPLDVVTTNNDARKSFIILDEIETYKTIVNNILNDHGAATKLRYLYKTDTERLTGPEAVKKAMNRFMELKVSPIYDVEFFVNNSGITLTNNSRRNFFRRHYPKKSVSYCGLVREYQSVDVSPKGIFALITRKISGKSNECHLIRQADVNESVINIVKFINIGYELENID
nr:tensin-3-like [Onthophagus taurus]